MARVIILLLDSCGIGESQDAVEYGDEGANTLGHIAAACAAGLADTPDRCGPLHLPNLYRLGLGQALLASSGIVAPGYDPEQNITGAYGYAVERSLGKDTPSGHWELAGVPVLFEWGYFPAEYPSFAETLVNDLCQQGKLPGILGNLHASGTDIINKLGEEHIKTGKPIVYTSADSVLQIAAHEKYFGLEKLYKLCDIARKLADQYRIGRVIARPFSGENGNFKRTANRRDYTTPPPEPTLLDQIVKANKKVVAIGKIADIFANKGVSEVIHGENNHDLFTKTLAAFKNHPDFSLIFTNFVDFDSAYGHRRDVAGYAKALEDFDKQLPELLNQLTQEDLVIITADHGCDPTFPGTDHTREHIPIVLYHKNIQPIFVGRRESFADIGQTIAEFLNLERLDYGISFCAKIFYSPFKI